jgi:hypothetical protein
MEAIKSELDSLYENNTWTIVNFPAGKNAKKAKQPFKIKKDNNNNSVRYKARLVVKIR